MTARSAAPRTPAIEWAEVVLPGRPLDECVTFFRERLGLRLGAVFPADEPAVAVLSGPGLRLRLDARTDGAPGRLRLGRRTGEDERHPQRDFSDQRFVRHVAADSPWVPGPTDGFEQRDTGIAAATRGLAGVRAIRPASESALSSAGHGGELLLRVLLEGAATLTCPGRTPEALAAGDAFAVPAGLPHALEDISSDLCLLEVALPGDGGGSFGGAR